MQPSWTRVPARTPRAVRGKGPTSTVDLLSSFLLWFMTDVRWDNRPANRFTPSPQYYGTRTWLDPGEIPSAYGRSSPIFVAVRYVCRRGARLTLETSGLVYKDIVHEMRSL